MPCRMRGGASTDGGPSTTNHPLPPRQPAQVPLLATCQLVQRMVVAERRQKEAALAELAALRKQMAHLQGGAAGGAVAVEQ